MPHARSAEIYDLIYGFRGYGRTCEYLEKLLDERRADVGSLLDVGCGTGGHLELFSRRFDCQGLDLSPEMLEVARRRCPTLPIHQADMVDFDLGCTFDVVTCLFSAVAYVRTVEGLHQAIGSMARHLRLGGLLLVEPWIDVERFWVGRVTLNVVEDETRKVAWMYTSAIEGSVSVLDVHYLIGTSDGVEHFVERQEMGLFDPAEYEEAFRRAGLSVDFDLVGPFGRGLYVGEKTDEA